MNWLAPIGFVAFIVAVVYATRSYQRGVARQRLLRHLASQPSCNAWVRKSSNSKSWLQVTEWSKNTVHSEQGELNLGEVVAFVIAYPSGDQIDQWGDLGQLPKGVHQWLKRESPPEGHELTEQMLKAGNQLVNFCFGRSASRPYDLHHYSTSLTNVSNTPFRVMRFGGYYPEDDKWIMNNITEGFFTHAHFVEWYGVDDTGWVQPGETVQDPSNYGSLPALWAYELETSDGESFWAGGIHR